jgi:hypothetical protein
LKKRSGRNNNRITSLPPVTQDEEPTTIIYTDLENENIPPFDSYFRPLE